MRACGMRWITRATYRAVGRGLFLGIHGGELGWFGLAARIEGDHAERPHRAVFDLEHEEAALGLEQQVEVLRVEAERVDRGIAGGDDAVERADEEADRIGAALALVEGHPAFGAALDELLGEG